MTKITSDGFIEVTITNEMIASAQAKANALGTLNNSIRQGKGNLAGFLGEECVLASFPGSIPNNTYEHDVTFEEISFEVKTKDRTVVPKKFYEASVANYNTRQKADYYCFVSLLRLNGSYTKGYVIGIIKKDDYKGQATTWNVGDIDPTNNWVVSAKCHNLPYSSLINFESFLDKN